MKKHFILQIENLARQYERFYYTVVLIIALVGYIFLLMPAIFISLAISGVYNLLSHAPTNEHWIIAGIFVLIASGALLFFFQIYRIKFANVRGFKLTRELTPALFEMIAEVRGHFKRPAIKSVVITGSSELFIESIPRRGFPVMFSNHLVIGLPLLQSLSVNEFRCQLARCIGQYSGIMPRIKLLIYRSSRLWDLYNRSLAKNASFIKLPLVWFFKIYTPFYQSAAAPAIRQVEMEADLCALDFINEKDAFDGLKSRAVSDVFFENHYWPNIRKMVMKNTNATIKPFVNLENIACATLSKGNRSRWLTDAYEKEQLPGELTPGLHQRMEYMGQTRLRSINGLDVTASEQLLGEARKKIIPFIDMLWRSDIQVKWVKQYRAKRLDVEKLKFLSRKSHQGILLPRDMLVYARLEKKLRGNPVIESLKKIFRRNMKNLLPDFIRTRVASAGRFNDIF